jgi:acyl-coenzyme A thioesterase PaaI-like protein
MTLSYDSENLREALAVQVLGGGRIEAQVHEGWDVFGIPHGGYLAALAGAAVLESSGKPDLFSITVHYLRKAKLGPLQFSVESVGGSRRFTTVTATARQQDEVVLSVMASLGDRTAFEGTTWRARPRWDPRVASLTSPSGSNDGPGFAGPAMAHRTGLRLDTTTLSFAAGDRGEAAEIRATMENDDGHPLAALIACDATPPAVWNALGAGGWVPTVELTAHLRARPVPGPLTIVANTAHVSGGFLEEDAVVHDVEGRLVAQSRQLARWSSAS